MVMGTEGFPSVSVGYEWGDDGSAGASSDGQTSYFVGVQFDEVGPEHWVLL